MRNALTILVFILGTAAHAAPERLRTGDVLQIVVPGPDPLAGPRTIEPDGAIELGAYGRLEVAGLPADQAQARLRAHLSTWLRSVDGVGLALHQRANLVLVTGRVGQPGLTPLRGDEGPWAVIQRAGGPSPGADLRRVVVVHAGHPRTEDLRAWLAGNRATPRPLSAGDTVFVAADPTLPGVHGAPGAFLDGPSLQRKVVVTGAVRTPGVYDRGPNLDTLTALALAGGTSSGAALGAVRVLGPSGGRTDDVAAILAGQRPRRPLPAGGVVVHVPHAAAADELSPAVRVLGAVQRGGRVPVPARGTDLLGALARAGGLRDDGDPSEVRVLRRGPGFTFAARYDLAAVMAEGGPLARVPVRPGDTIWVGRTATLPAALKEWVRMTADLLLLGGAVALIASR